MGFFFHSPLIYFLFENQLIPKIIHYCIENKCKKTTQPVVYFGTTLTQPIGNFRLTSTQSIAHR